MSIKEESIDKHSGVAGTFVNHPTKGVRVTLEEWEKEQDKLEQPKVKKPVTGDSDAISST